MPSLLLERQRARVCCTNTWLGERTLPFLVLVVFDHLLHEDDTRSKCSAAGQTVCSVKKHRLGLTFNCFEIAILNIYKGGKVSLQIGHCSRYFIQPSKQLLWKICRHGVTMYVRRASSPPARPASPDAPASTTGTSRSCMQMAQSKIRLPFSLASLATEARLAAGEVGARSWIGDAGAEPSAAACEKPMGIVAPSSSSRRTGW